MMCIDAFGESENPAACDSRGDGSGHMNVAYGGSGLMGWELWNSETAAGKHSCFMKPFTYRRAFADATSLHQSDPDIAEEISSTHSCIAYNTGPALFISVA